MIDYVALRPLDAPVELTQATNVFSVLTVLYKAGRCFLAGSPIWVRREDCYAVYTLNESWEKNREPLEDFACRLEAEIMEAEAFPQSM